jgi:hypothetical protein
LDGFGGEIVAEFHGFGMKIDVLSVWGDDEVELELRESAMNTDWCYAVSLD